MAARNLGNPIETVVRLRSKDTGFPEAQRIVLWSIFERVRSGLKARGLITYAELFSRLATAILKAKNVPLTDYAVIDEAQDISIAHLRFFAALGANRPNALLFAGDLGQRILPAIHSRGGLSASIFADARAPCALTTALPIKSASKRIDYSGQRLPT